MKNLCQIIGLGVHIPENVLSNQDFEKIMDTSDEWIFSRTGISKRHIIDENQSTSDIGFLAAQRALLDANISKEKITHIMVATCTPEMLTPSVSCLIAGKLGLSVFSGQNCNKTSDGESFCSNELMCFDFNAACSGFVYGLEIAKAFLTQNEDATILLICTEAMSRRMNYKDRSTSILFGDGAAAVVLQASKESSEKTIQGFTKNILEKSHEKFTKSSLFSIRDISCGSDGSLASLIEIGGATKKIMQVGDTIGEDYFLSMQGQEVYKYAVRCMSSECLKLLARNGLTIDDIDLFIPHQANARIIEAVGARIKIPHEKVFMNLVDYGNTSAASIPLAIYDARNANLLQKEKNVLIVTFGAGLTWACAFFSC